MSNCRPPWSTARDAVRHLLNAVCGRPWDALDRSIDVLAVRLRRESVEGRVDPIEAARNAGYVFTAATRARGRDPASRQTVIGWTT